METIAVYWEPKIKTYGFKDVLDLSLLELGFQSGRLPEWGLGIYDMGDFGLRFELVFAQHRERGLHVYLLIKRQWVERLMEHITKRIRKEHGEACHLTTPVELVYFFGPHFGERYGVADSTFRPLTRNAIPILSAGCYGSVVYLVLPEGMAQRAKVILAETFETPVKNGISS